MLTLFIGRLSDLPGLQPAWFGIAVPFESNVHSTLPIVAGELTRNAGELGRAYRRRQRLDLSIRCVMGVGYGRAEGGGCAEAISDRDRF